ncbi:MAG: hypothetical protein LBD25_07825 [Coriobacteriales bacterium]|jgi:energy-coupling factor transporter ATP-binding protein EcfA2|nr:hypothetical protein [Coriobacteriales bacterium]
MTPQEKAESPTHARRADGALAAEASFGALTVVVGHYGSGKTNLALNIALLLARRSNNASVIDLDIVNPYFRTSDYGNELAASTVDVLGPVYGASNLDSPSLMPGIDVRIRTASKESPVVVDVGGDPDGARALARFEPQLAAHRDCAVLGVVNFCRPETAAPDDALAVLRGIEKASGTRVTHLVCNTHLKDHTTAETVLDALAPLIELSTASGIPVAFVCVPRSLYAVVHERIAASGLSTLLTDVLVTASWEPHDWTL